MRRAALILALAALLWPAAVRAEERILSYVSDIAVQRNASLAVTEAITVRAENNEIKHGIYRDFPTRYRGRRGGQVRVDFMFEGATLDGQPVEASTKSIRNGVRIRLGDPDTFVDPGDHRYVIRYRTTRQLGRFAEFDELYWNVTGNGWIFPIDRAEARITLPSRAAFGKRAVYTGPQGEVGKQARVVSDRPGEIIFRTTGPLGRHEGLTVAVAWPKGIVSEASAGQRWRWWLADNGPLIVAALALIGILVFYGFAWHRAGRDPRPGTVVPLFTPPDNLSPAAMRYIWKMKADNRAFAAALVAMGVKGHVRLIEEDGGWLSSDKTRIERLAASAPLAADEEAALRELAGPGASIVMEQKNHARFSAAKNGLEEILKAAYEGTLFHRNWGWAIAGLLLLLTGLWLVAATIVASAGTRDLAMVAIPAGALIVTVLLAMVIQDSSGTGKCLLTLMAVLAGTVAAGLGFPVIPAALQTGWWQPVALPLLALPVVISAFWWMSAPTREGRAVLDRIAGFRQYLSIAERERLDRMTAPKDTPEVFERYLPYAIALGVENRWAERFRDVLAAASVQGQVHGFAWYSGSGNPWNDTGGFVDDVGSSLASSVSSASTAPGSSSGSGGGGSSGGGGGGGGGGGW